MSMHALNTHFADDNINIILSEKFCDVKSYFSCTNDDNFHRVSLWMVHYQRINQGKQKHGYTDISIHIKKRHIESAQIFFTDERMLIEEESPYHEHTEIIDTTQSKYHSRYS